MSCASLFLSLTYQRSSLLLLLLMIVMFVEKVEKICQLMCYYGGQRSDILSSVLKVVYSTLSFVLIAGDLKLFQHFGGACIEISAKGFRVLLWKDVILPLHLSKSIQKKGMPSFINKACTDTRLRLSCHSCLCLC